MKGYESIIWVKWVGYGENEDFRGGAVLADHATHAVVEKKNKHGAQPKASGSGSK